MKISKLTTLNFLHILNDGFLVSLPLLLPFIKTDLHLTLTQIGSLGSVLNLLGIFLALPAGIIAAKWGGLRSLTLAVVVYATGFLITSLAPNFYLVFLAFLIAGLSFGIFHPIAFASVAQWTPQNSRGKAMGNFTAIGDLGRVGISAGITFLATYIGWRYTSALYGFFALISFVLISLVIKKEIVQITKKTSPISIKYLLSHKSFLLVCLTDSLDSIASASLFVFIPFLLLSKGINSATLGLFTGFFFIGNFLGKSLLGRITDKFPNTDVFIIAETLMAINLIIFSTSNSWLLTSVIAVILGALTKGTVPVLQTMTAQIAQNEGDYEQVFALKSLITSIAGAIAPLMFGVIADHYGVVKVFTFSAGFAILAILSALALKISTTTPKKSTI